MPFSEKMLSLKRVHDLLGRNVPITAQSGSAGAGGDEAGNETVMKAHAELRMQSHTPPLITVVQEALMNSSPRWSIGWSSSVEVRVTPGLIGGFDNVSRSCILHRGEASLVKCLEMTLKSLPSDILNKRCHSVLLRISCLWVGDKQKYRYINFLLTVWRN